MITTKAEELNTSTRKDLTNVLSFHTLQTFQTKSDSELGRTMYIGLFDAAGVIKVPNDENVRDYLKLGKDGKETASSGVHALIYDTLQNRPEDFHLLNGGITICAEGIIARDNDRKKLSLKNASIINGAQTRGVLKKFLSENTSQLKDIIVKVEIIISQDNDFFDDISIARNQQTQVKAISISGKKGLIDDLQEATEKALRINESQKDRFDTEKLVQLIFASMPKNIYKQVFTNKKKDEDLVDKSSCYSSKATMFRKFNEFASKRKDSEVYKYFIDIAQDVLETYFHLLQNKPVLTKFMDYKEFRKKGYKINPKTKEVTILDGFLFPLIAMLSYFVDVDESGKYSLPILSDDYYKSISKLITLHSGVASHGNVQTLGKTSNSYTTPYKFIELMMANNSLEFDHKKD